MYLRITQLALIAYRKGLRMIIENPKGTLHYLTRYWALEPSYIDRDRTQRGDYYKKPTQYWFINCEPEHNYIFEAQTINKLQTKGATTVKYMCSSSFATDTGIKVPRHIARSLIHPDYANRFIREFIIDEAEGND